MPSLSYTFTAQAASVHLVEATSGQEWEFPINEVILDSDGDRQVSLRINQSGVFVSVKASEVASPVSANAPALVANLTPMFYLCCP
jgi:hypothetical protein